MALKHPHENKMNIAKIEGCLGQNCPGQKQNN